MQIQGLQKLTLLDYPGRTACTVFLSGCNFRCPFCHNAPLLTAADEDGMDEDELLAFLKKRQGLLDGVAVTGGEPLLRPELPLCWKRSRRWAMRSSWTRTARFRSSWRQLCVQGWQITLPWISKTARRATRKQLVFGACPDAHFQECFVFAARHG